MRYVNIDSAVFVDADGVPRRVKKVRPIPAYTLAFELRLRDGDSIDEIAARDSVFGRGGEADSYRLVDFNAAALVEARFDLSRLRTLKVPET